MPSILSGNALKIIAAIAMLIDHMGSCFSREISICGSSGGWPIPSMPT